MGLGEIGLRRDGLAMGCRGLLKSFHSRSAAPRFPCGERHAGIERKRAPRLRAAIASSMRAGEPAHLAEIGLVERHVRRQRGRALQMADRLAQTPAPLRCEAELVRGLGRFRYALRNGKVVHGPVFGSAGLACTPRLPDGIGGALYNIEQVR